MEARGFLSEAQNHQRVAVWVNGISHGNLTFNLDDGGNMLHSVIIDISNEVFGVGDEIEIKFKMQDSLSPKSIGLSADYRKLGLGLQSLVLRKAQPKN
jgi:hypothetical protein